MAAVLQYIDHSLPFGVLKNIHYASVSLHKCMPSMQHPDGDAELALVDEQSVALHFTDSTF